MVKELESYFDGLMVSGISWVVRDIIFFQFMAQTKLKRYLVGICTKQVEVRQ